MRLLIFARTSYGSFAQSAVMPSSEVTARIATTFAYVRPSPITPTLRTGVRIANDCHTVRYSPAALISSMTIQSASRSVSSRSAVTSPMIRIARPGPGDGRGAGAGERLAVAHRLRQPELEPDRADLVLEQVPQRLDELEPHVGGQAA